MTDPITPILEIIRARNIIAYPYGSTDARLLAAADTLLRHSDNPIDLRDARDMKDRIRANAAQRQAEALQGFDLYVQPNGTPASGWVAWAATGLVFLIVGYIIGAVAQ